MNQTQKILLIMIIATLTVVGAYAFVFYQVRKASRETSEAEQLIQKEHEKQGKQNSARHLFDETAEGRKELDSRIATKGSLVGFFEELEVLAKEAGVEMEIAKIEENIELDQVIPEAKEDDKEKPKPKAHPAAKDLEWMQMDIEANGPWEATYRFLTFIELLPHHIKLSQVRFDQGRIEESQTGELMAPLGDWRLTFTAKMLQQKEK